MFKKIGIILLPLVLISCATGSKYKRGSVAMKISETIAHINLGKKIVKVGDDIQFYYNDCEHFDFKKEGLDALCTLKKIGKGKVTKLMGAHYSTVKTDGTFNFKEGTLVQIVKP